MQQSCKVEALQQPPLQRAPAKAEPGDLTRRGTRPRLGRPARRAAPRRGSRSRPACFPPVVSRLLHSQRCLMCCPMRCCPRHCLRVRTQHRRNRPTRRCLAVAVQPLVQPLRTTGGIGRSSPLPSPRWSPSSTRRWASQRRRSPRTLNQQGAAKAAARRSGVRGPRLLRSA